MILTPLPVEQLEPGLVVELMAELVQVVVFRIQHVVIHIVGARVAGQHVQLQPGTIVGTELKIDQQPVCGVTEQPYLMDIVQVENPQQTSPVPMDHNATLDTDSVRRHTTLQHDYRLVIPPRGGVILGIFIE